MENKFTIKLRAGLDVWPNFIGICERRNLLTHTGVVSLQYVNVCKRANLHRLPPGGSLIGVDPSYYSKSVLVVAEVALKLCYVMWRKFSPETRSDADRAFNELIPVNAQNLKIIESTRLQMVVNLANAKRLAGRLEEATAMLEAMD